MKIVKKLILLIIVLLASYFSSLYFGGMYLKLLKQSAGSFLDGTSLIGLPLAYIFFLTLLLTAFGGAKKYWWIGIGLIPAVLFEVAFDLRHLYFPLAIGLVAWLVGRGLALLTERK